MTRRFSRGLVVGKFAPLHRGHQLLIDAAFDRCDEVIILSYSVPELTGCEAARREHWLESLYPNAIRVVMTDQSLSNDSFFDRLPHDDAGDDIQRQFIAHVIAKYVRKTVDAVFTSEPYGDGFAADLTVRQRVIQPKAPEVSHILVDIDRAKFPTSGRVIRADIHAHRQSLDPHVYASFVERVAILGGESSGKSTLAAALANTFGTMYVAEFGRERWEATQGKLSLADMDLIAREQVARENAALLRAHRYVFCDTTPLTTLLYSRDLFSTASDDLVRLADRCYDHYVLCEPDFEFVQDGTRRDASFRLRQHQWYIDELAKRGINYLSVSGNIESRLATIQARLLPSSVAGS